MRKWEDFENLVMSYLHWPQKESFNTARTQKTLAWTVDGFCGHYDTVFEFLVDQKSLFFNDDEIKCGFEEQ